MIKTTVYLPEDLKSALERMAAEEQCSEAELIRESLRATVGSKRRPRPRIPLTGDGLGDPTAAERAEDLLAGFGRR